MSSFFEYRKTTYFDVFCLNFSVETKIKTLFLILYFSLSKKRNGTLGTQIMNHKNGSIYLSQKLLCCIIFSSIFCYPFIYLQEDFYVGNNIDTFSFFFIRKILILFASLFLKLLFYFVLIMSSRYFLIYGRKYLINFL